LDVVLSERFEQAYDALARPEKRSVRKAIALLSENPRHPGLRVKKMEGRGPIWEARPSKRLRMTFEVTGSFLLLRNVGDHDKVLKRP
jgi:mRNA interferase RelE/StbE